MALYTVTGRYECVLAVMTGTARLAFIHLIHLCLERSSLVWENLGVAVSAFIHFEVEFMAEVSFACFCFKKYVARFISLVTLVALSRHCEGVFAVVATAARLAALHAFHGCFECACFVRERFGVAF